MDRSVSLDEIWEAFNPFVQQGKIDYMGSSNFAGWDLIRAQSSATERKIMDLVSEQHLYNLMCRLPELEVQYEGIGIIPWSPLSGGLLGSKLDKLKGTRGEFSNDESIQKHRSQLEAYAKFCKEPG